MSEIYTQVVRRASVPSKNPLDLDRIIILEVLDKIKENFIEKFVEEKSTVHRETRRLAYSLKLRELGRK